MDNTRMRVEFDIIKDGNFDVNRITEALAIKPYRIMIKGEEIPNTGRKYPQTVWTYSTKEENTLKLDYLLKQVVKLFTPKLDLLCSWEKEYGFEYQIDIVAKIENNIVPKIFFDSSIMQFAAKIGAVFDIDTYVYK